MVPTTNIILKWIRNQSGAHRLDENLAEVMLITKDAFEPSLPLSVVIHIDYKKAPPVIQRSGDVIGPESTDDRPRDPQAEALRQQIRDAVTMKPVGNGTTSRP